MLLVRAIAAFLALPAMVGFCDTDLARHLVSPYGAVLCACAGIGGVGYASAVVVRARILCFSARYARALGPA